MTMVDTETPLINSTNDWVFPRIYPRYMLCAPDPNVNLAEYKQIHICYHLRTNVTVVENLPEFVPTVVKPLTFGLSWVPFNGMAMCCKLLMETPMIDIKWESSNLTLMLLFSIHPSEPFIKLSTNNGKRVRCELSAKVRKISPTLSKVEVYRFYTGPYSNYSDTYPTSLNPFLETYPSHVFPRYFFPF